jgi:hypothetical protein
MTLPRPATYLTPDEIDQRAKERETDAQQAPSGSARQALLDEAARLRTYSDMKRWLTPQRALGK